MSKDNTTITDIILRRIDKFETKVDTKLDRIETQTTQTNGRVTALEHSCNALTVFKDSSSERLTSIEAKHKVREALDKSVKDTIVTRRWFTELIIKVLPHIGWMVVTGVLLLQRNGLI